MKRTLLSALSLVVAVLGPSMESRAAAPAALTITSVVFDDATSRLTGAVAAAPEDTLDVRVFCEGGAPYGETATFDQASLTVIGGAVPQ